jgi:hypothetical protein
MAPSQTDGRRTKVRRAAAQTKHNPAFGSKPEPRESYFGFNFSAAELMQ